jgi:hypothetical protein
MPMKRTDRPKVLKCCISLEFSVHEKVQDLRVRFLKKSTFDSPLSLQYNVLHENDDADHINWMKNWTSSCQRPLANPEETATTPAALRCINCPEIVPSCRTRSGIQKAAGFRLPPE